MARKNIILLGGGGHCSSCIEVIESTCMYNITGFFDDNETQTVSGFPYQRLGTLSMLPQFVKPGTGFLVAVGQIKSALLRKRLFNLISQNEGLHATVISPFSVFSSRSSVGKGSIIHHQVIVNANSHIGKNAIINNKSLIEHDCVVGDHCHISTGAILNGGCNIGNEVFIGSNSVLIQGVSVASRVVIGAGSVVTTSITEPGVYVGNPAQKINTRKMRLYA